MSQSASLCRPLRSSSVLLIATLLGDGPRRASHSLLFSLGHTSLLPCGLKLRVDHAEQSGCSSTVRTLLPRNSCNDTEGMLTVSPRRSCTSTLPRRHIYPTKLGMPHRFPASRSSTAAQRGASQLFYVSRGPNMTHSTCYECRRLHD